MLLKTIARNMFVTMRRSSVHRGHPFTLTFTEFFTWLMDHDFKAKVLHGIQTGLSEDKPSVDRLDTSLGYELTNMKLVTWGENRQRESERQSTHVYQYTKEGVLVSEYTSINLAAKIVGCSSREICIVLDNPKRSCKKHRWTTKRNPNSN